MTLEEKYYAYILDNEKVSKEEEIVFSIISDLTNRSGLDNTWDSIDQDTRGRIINTWIEIVKEKNG